MLDLWCFKNEIMIHLKSLSANWLNYSIFELIRSYSWPAGGIGHKLLSPRPSRTFGLLDHLSKPWMLGIALISHLWSTQRSSVFILCNFHLIKTGVVQPFARCRSQPGLYLVFQKNLTLSEYFKTTQGWILVIFEEISRGYKTYPGVMR